MSVRIVRRPAFTLPELLTATVIMAILLCLTTLAACGVMKAAGRLEVAAKKHGARLEGALGGKVICATNGTTGGTGKIVITQLGDRRVSITITTVGVSNWTATFTGDARIRVWGSGGHGYLGSVGVAGQGGGGGGFTEKVMAVTLNTIYACNINAAGSEGASGFDTAAANVAAQDGFNGDPGSATPGGGGQGNLSASGDYGHNGGAGAVGGVANGGGGGGSATSMADGSDGVLTVGGAGQGTGGRGSTPTVNGTVGGTPGAGGGGGAGTVNTTGKAGGVGQIIIDQIAPRGSLAMMGVGR